MVPRETVDKFGERMPCQTHAGRVLGPKKLGLEACGRGRADPGRALPHPQRCHGLPAVGGCSSGLRWLAVGRRSGSWRLACPSPDPEPLQGVALPSPPAGLPRLGLPEPLLAGLALRRLRFLGNLARRARRGSSRACSAGPPPRAQGLAARPDPEFSPSDSETAPASCRPCRAPRVAPGAQTPGVPCSAGRSCRPFGRSPGSSASGLPWPALRTAFARVAGQGRYGAGRAFGMASTGARPGV